MVPLNLLSDKFLMHFWSLRTVANVTSSVVVHQALACHFLLFIGGVVAVGEAQREGWLWEFLC